jgi:biopolymer transport protein ExbD
MASVNVGSEGDSPVAINVTPLVDIIFCLCVFFMISFRFKQIEGRFDAWLPRTTGVGPGPVNTSDLLWSGPGTWVTPVSGHMGDTGR